MTCALKQSRAIITNAWNNIFHLENVSSTRTLSIDGLLNEIY